MVWVCKLSYARIVSIKNTNPEFFESICIGMEREIFSKIQFRLLKELFCITEYVDCDDCDSTFNCDSNNCVDYTNFSNRHKILSVDIDDYGATKNLRKVVFGRKIYDFPDIVLLSTQDNYGKNMVANHGWCANLDIDSSIVLLTPKSSDVNLLFISAFLRSKYALLQFEKNVVLNSQNVKELSLSAIENIKIPILSRYFEEKISILYSDALDIQSAYFINLDSTSSTTDVDSNCRYTLLFDSIIRLIEKHIEKEASCYD